MTVRGIRNNNPGNLGYNSFTQGLGATGVEPEGRFAVFPTMAMGITALCKNLLNYYDQHGVDSIGNYTDANGVAHEGAIDRWAPGNENNTNAYIAFVCTVLNCQPTDVFNFHNADFLYWMATAIGEEECGHDVFTQGVTDADLNAGVSAALGG